MYKPMLTLGLAVLLLSLNATAHADEPEVIGWWRMEAPLGTSVADQAIPDAASKGKHTGTAQSWEKGSLVAFHELPGRYIYDPLTDKAYSNQSSIRFQSSGQDEGRGTSDYIEVDAGIGKRQPPSFTIEGFMKSEGGIGKWHDIIVLREQGKPHPHAWSLSTENLKGAKKLRYGGHEAPKGYWASYQNNPSVTGGDWHHFAYVFEKTADGHKARLYWDGELVSEAKPPAPAYTDAQRLFIGGGPGSAGWNGYLDEVRLTGAALEPGQFLQASDHPGKPEGGATPVSLGLRKEPMKPLESRVKLDLPEPQIGPASVQVPADAGLINVQTDYQAKGDGMTDDTAAIKRAVAENIGKHRTLYFPPGIYVVSEPIDWKNSKGQWNAFLTWQGAGMGETFIYLRPGSVEFGSADNPRAITTSGSIPGTGGSNPVTGGGNRAHNNYIMDMTFFVGDDNPGAIGVDFNASNTGAMENVRIIARGDAAEGLRLTRAVGCLLIKNIEVVGFRTGVHLAGDLYGSVLTNIHLRDQREAGLLNEGHMVALQGLTSVNSVPAVINRGDGKRFPDSGLLVMIDSTLTGGSPDAAAIENQTAILARNVKAQGYGTAIQQDGKAVATGAEIGEYAWPDPVTLFDAPKQTVDLPVLQPPAIDDLPVDQWVSVGQFLEEAQEKDADDSGAIQKAIDSGARGVYFPRRSYHIMKPVVVRGNVQRLIGYQSWLLGPDKDQPGEGMIVFENEHPVAFERFNTKRMAIDIKTAQPVVLRHLMSLPTTALTHPAATIFSENTVGSQIALSEGQSWRAWQLNIETSLPPAMVENHGGTFWVLGYKTEQGNTVLTTTRGGKSEVLGGLWYPAQGFGKGNEPVPPWW